MTPIPTLEPIGVGVPVLAYIKGQLELLVVSSVTETPFHEFPFITLGYYNYAFSPDGETLAIVPNAQLYWTDQLSRL